MAKINVTAAPGGGGGGGGNLQLLSGASMSATLTAVTDTSNTQSPLKLSTTGVQTTSKLQITTADTNYIDAEDNSGNNRFTVGRDPSSQQVNVDFASNPTGSTTIVGAIRTYVDGVNLSEVMTFREDGNVGINTNTPGAKLDVHSAGAIVAQFNKTGSGNSYIQQLTAGAGKWKHGFTSATGAFDIIDDVNSLTRLSLLNTGQLKLNAYTSTSAFTGTTAGFLAFDASGNILSVAAPAASPAGTTGAIQFNNAGAFGADSTNFFWDDTNNRLGVGTATPTVALDIKGDASFGNSQLYKISDNGSGNFVLGGNTVNTYYDATTFRVRNGANTPLYAEATRVGIGTTSPTAKLQVIGNGSTSATTSLLVQNSAGTAALTVKDNLFIEGLSSANQLNFRFGPTNQGIGTRNGDFTIGLSDSTSIGGGRFYSNGTGIFWIDGLTEGASKAQNYPMIFGSRAAATGTSVGSYTTEENGSQSYFGFYVAQPSAQVVINSTTRGFLPPRMTNAQRLAIASPAVGLMVYCTDAVEGLYVYKSTGWTFVI
jgi:hypothetical protein